ncbi:dimethyladenosine transferase 2, mitochondrial [Cotesia glomerata]|uniref:rRNA adenine N(6)-methyltransferase n=1 Tax=Cotesia glomerata TaxID=32391 RepID=A0AAV7JAD8_COTGL|nr:dimethyladenosine transferase 2, mitochondrial [Cotesia glomerata]KAH0568524.1 hypothetical protein KQX54_021134 [Cotesia glomerata]
MSVRMKTNMFFRMFVTKTKHLAQKELRLLDNDQIETSQKLPFNEDTDLEVNKSDLDEEISLENIKGNAKVIKALKDMGDVDVNRIPQICLSKVQSPKLLYLLNKNTAKDLASIIANDIIKSNVPVVEVNSGPGFLTEELLKAGVPRIYMNEKYEEFHWYLEPLLKKYGKRLSLRKYNLLQLSLIQSSDDRINGKKMQDIFGGIDTKQWDQEPSMQIISIVPNKPFLYSVQYSMIDQYLSSFGRIILYIVTKPSIAKIFENIPDSSLHKPRNIFLQTMFDSKVLGSLPRASFFPLNSNTKKKRPNSKLYIDDNEKMSVMRLEAKKDFLSDDFTKRDALMFLYFLKSHMRRRDARIIPELEKLMPGCGRQLIRHNLNIYSRFSELSSYQLFILFQIIKSWAQFENSSFVEDLKFQFEQET